MSAKGKQYIISVLFRKILTCLYENTTSNFFEVEPPFAAFVAAAFVTFEA